jgi:hypothetical protein
MRSIAILACIFIAGPGEASAHVSRGWLDYAFGKLGLDGIKSLSVVQEEGLILSRVRKDYAAFTFGTQRLSAANRKSETIDVSEYGSVLEFETCAPTNDLLSGRIHKARFRHKVSDADKLVDELLDINEFFFKLKGENWKLRQATKSVLAGSHSLAKSLGGASHPVEVEFRLSKETHQIVLEASSPSMCEKP